LRRITIFPANGKIFPVCDAVFASLILVGATLSGSKCYCIVKFGEALAISNFGARGGTPSRESSVPDSYNHPEGGIRGMQELTQERTKERWMELCEQAAVESDSQKLMALISEINRMLDSKMEEQHEPRAGFSVGR
jgi:hypothetical protein